LRLLMPTAFAQSLLSQSRPASVRDVVLPRRQRYYPSPVRWRDEIIYFLLVDRFSDGRDAGRPLLDRSNLAAARRAGQDGQPWRWDRWWPSGSDRWQGGNLRGIASRLDYLQGLGVTTVWLSPVLKQRGHLDTYHGYGAQDFLDVDPRMGTREDLVGLVDAAHARSLRVILDIIFNHSGSNWLYPPDTPGGEYKPQYTASQWRFGSWRGADGAAVDGIARDEDGVWPTELQRPERYTRAGSGSLGAGEIDDPHAEHKRSDFEDLRDFALDAPDLLSDLARCYQHWIALADVDGYRIDTLKHVDFEDARAFCGALKEFAANIGKDNFFLVGEVAGGDRYANSYLEALAQNLNATLDIGEMRPALTAVAKGLADPRAYFSGFDVAHAALGSHRNYGDHVVSILDDHDHVSGQKLRFSAQAASAHQVFAGVAIQLLTLGIPCLYYGTEQAFAGPEASESQWLPGWGSHDRYLREAMFGPEHPRAGGRTGLDPGPDGNDGALAGFGPFGTAGHHCFDPEHPAYRRIAALAALRGEYPVLRAGRQYLRPTSFLGRPFGAHGAGEILGWSRILDDEEALCVLNPHGTAVRGADVLVDAQLNARQASLRVVFNSAEAAGVAAGAHPVGAAVPVGSRDGAAYVEIRDLPPSEVLVLVNHSG
jgi:glycosidase